MTRKPMYKDKKYSFRLFIHYDANDGKFEIRRVVIVDIASLSLKAGGE